MFSEVNGEDGEISSVSPRPPPPPPRAGSLRALEDKRVSFGANLHDSCRRALSCVPLAVVQISSGYLRGPVGTGAWEPEQESLNALEAAVVKPFVSNFRPSCFLPASG